MLPLNMLSLGLSILENNSPYHTGAWATWLLPVLVPLTYANTDFWPSTPSAPPSILPSPEQAIFVPL